VRPGRSGVEIMKGRDDGDAPRASLWWFLSVGSCGLLFGTLAERRPFGQDVLAHPLVVFFALVGAGLVILRLLLRRPVPEVISERSLLLGCILGAGAFLLGNWIAVHLGARH
jgi:hypothetical protein